MGMVGVTLNGSTMEGGLTRILAWEEWAKTLEPNNLCWEKEVRKCLQPMKLFEIKMNRIWLGLGAISPFCIYMKIY
jgi:hypothetical protein